MSNVYDSSDSEDDVDDQRTLTSTPSLLTPPPNNNTPSSQGYGGGDASLRPRSRSRTSSFSSPLLMGMGVGSSHHPRSRSASIISADGGTPGNSSNNAPGSRPSSANRSSRPSSAQRQHRTSAGRSRRSITPILLGPVNRSNVHTFDSDDDTRPSSQGRGAGGVSARDSNPSPSSASASASARHRSSPHMNSRSHGHGQGQGQGQGNRVVGLGAGLAVGTVLSTKQLSSLQESRREHRYNSSLPYKSAKQGPGHRKVRRWNNDKFIGIATDISHSNPMRGKNIANIYAEAEMQRDRYTIPHANRHSRTIFSTLATAASGSAHSRENEKEEEEEVHHFYYEDDDDDIHHKVSLSPQDLKNIRDRFIDGEVGVSDMDHDHHHHHRSEAVSNLIYRNGHRMMMRNVDHRLRRIVERACRPPRSSSSSSPSSPSSSNFARTVVDAFQKLIIHSFEESNVNSDSVNGAGAEEAGIHTSPYSMEDDSEVWKAVLVQKPMITRKKTSQKRDETKKNAVTIRFLFAGEENAKESSNSNGKGAFHRLLLHAVCQFHGLEASSSTTKKGHRMLTVNGCCRGSQFRFLDYVRHDENDEDYDDEDVNGNGNGDEAKEESCVAGKRNGNATTAQQHLDETPATQMLLESMAALRVK